MERVSPHISALDPTQQGLKQFIPPVLFRWPGFATHPEHEVAALFIDVAGFTSLSESLAMLGPEGGEILEHTIARYFDALLDVIERYDGLPIRISGDALTVIFPKLSGDLREAALRALACAAALRSAGTAVSRVGTPGGAFALDHKIGVAAGRLICGQVGDPRLRAEFVFAGASLDQAVAAEHHARAGEVWASPGVAQLLEGLPLWARAVHGYQRLRDDECPALNQVCGRGHTGLEADDQGASSGDRAALLPGDRAPCADGCAPAIDADSAALARYLPLIPSAVRQHAAQGTLNYLCRHQNLTVLFAACPGMALDEPDGLNRLDAHYRQMQQIIEQFGGFLSEFEPGDKGAKLIVLFGAPSMLEDPCGQAARCAQAMQQGAREFGLISDQRIGLATGRLYVGRIGCRSLVKYSALGDRMNLAARLMSAAGRWAVLAERHTVESSARAVRWGAQELLKVKGKEEQVAVSALATSSRPGGRERRGKGLIGRTHERQVCNRMLEDVARGEGGVIELHGPPGIGKTRLIEAIRRVATDRGDLRVLSWNGNAGLRSSPLSAWRPLLLDLMGTSERATPEELLERFRQWHDTLPGDIRSGAALLAPLVGVPWEVDPILAQLPPERVLALRQSAIVDCVGHDLTLTPRVLIVDNAERLDAPSIQVLLELAPLLKPVPLLVIVAHRPPAADQRDPFSPLHDAEAVRGLELKPLPARECARLATRRLKAQQLDPELEALLATRAQGNPFLVEAWIDVLRDHGQIHVLENVAFLDPTRRMQALPDRLEALILTQLERLPPDAQLTVRVASVIGQSLTPAEIAALHPENLSEATVTAHLRMASRADLLWYDRANAPRMFFSRPEVREVIHDSLPFHLRRTLHAQRVFQLLSFLETEPDGDLALLLAEHHEYIEDLEARQRFFARAVSVSRDQYDHRGRARWARRLLETCEKASNHAGMLEALRNLQESLSFLGENEEREQVLQRWVQEAEQQGEPRALVQALQSSALAYQQRGDATTAIATLSRALEVARGLNDPEVLADALLMVCSVHGEGGRNQQSLEASEEALRCAPDTNPDRLFRLNYMRGFALSQVGQPAEAYRFYQQALRYCEATGEIVGKAALLGNIAVVLWATGKPEEGHAHLAESLELKRKFGNRREIGLGLHNVGFSFCQLGDLQKARTFTEEALRMFIRLRYLRGELMALGNLGEILWLSGAFDEAAQYYARAEALLAKHPHEPLQIELWLRQGELALTLQDWLTALNGFERALERATALDMAAFRCNALEGLAEVRRYLAEPEEALRLIQQALELLEADPTLVSCPQRVWWRAARVMTELGDHAAAREYQARALELLESEQSRLTSHTARARVARAFPWNREISRWGSTRRKPAPRRSALQHSVCE